MDATKFRKDFLSYSGGFTPNEAGDEMMTYIEVGAWMDSTVSREVIEVWFDEWLDELEQ
jgi:hypothetical protein